MKPNSKEDTNGRQISDPEHDFLHEDIHCRTQKAGLKEEKQKKKIGIK